MNNAGVLTQVVFIGGLEWYKENHPDDYEKMIIRYRHGAKFFKIVDDEKDIIAIAKDLVKSQMKLVRR
jgi:hypothetical protein